MLLAVSRVAHGDEFQYFREALEPSQEERRAPTPPDKMDPRCDANFRKKAVVYDSLSKGMGSLAAVATLALVDPAERQALEKAGQGHPDSSTNRVYKGVEAILELTTRAQSEMGLVERYLREHLEDLARGVRPRLEISQIQSILDGADVRVGILVEDLPSGAKKFDFCRRFRDKNGVLKNDPVSGAYEIDLSKKIFEAMPGEKSATILRFLRGPFSAAIQHLRSQIAATTFQLNVRAIRASVQAGLRALSSREKPAPRTGEHPDFEPTRVMEPDDLPEGAKLRNSQIEQATPRAPAGARMGSGLSPLYEETPISEAADKTGATTRWAGDPAARPGAGRGLGVLRAGAVPGLFLLADLGVHITRSTLPKNFLGRCEYDESRISEISGTVSTKLAALGPKADCRDLKFDLAGLLEAPAGTVGGNSAPTTFSLKTRECTVARGQVAELDKRYTQKGELKFQGCDKPALVVDDQRKPVGSFWVDSKGVMQFEQEPGPNRQFAMRIPLSQKVGDWDFDPELIECFTLAEGQKIERPSCTTSIREALRRAPMAYSGSTPGLMHLALYQESGKQAQASNPRMISEPLQAFHENLPLIQKQLFWWSLQCLPAESQPAIPEGSLGAAHPETTEAR